MRTNTHLRVAILSALLGVTALGACSSQPPADEAQRRRALLTPPDTRLEREERERKARLFDDKGELLESDQKVAGLVMPRGLSAAKQVEHQWFFKGDQVPAETIVRYFEARVKGAEISRSFDGSLVIFSGVRPNGDQNAAPLTLQISKLTGSQNATAVYVREPMPAARRYSQSEAEALLKERRARAD